MRWVIRWCVLAGLGGACVGCSGPRSAGSVDVSRHGLAARFDAGIDRVTFFGEPHGANLLYVTDLHRAVPRDGSYVFWGGCYTWVSPQKNVAGTALGWLDADGVSFVDWPPDPAMDVGPARRVGRSVDSFAVVGPDMRSGLREEKQFRIVRRGCAEFSYSLRNRGAFPVTAGPWITTAASLDDVLAVRMPAGTRVHGWDEACVARFHAITGEPDSRGWALVELSRADWEGGIKVYLSPGADERARDVEIAIWRREAKAWLHRSLGPMSSGEAARLDEVGEGPVALYIQPNGGKDAIVEAELYGPVIEIEPGGVHTAIETWRAVGAEAPSTSALP